MKDATAPMNILIIAAHPDDEVLGAGATAARLAKEGHLVYHLILGQGALSRDDADPGYVKQLQKDARTAAKVLGVKDVFFAGLPDNAFDSEPLLRVVKEIEKVRDKVQPDLVFTHHAGDCNVDHRKTHYATLAAFRPLPGSRHVRLLSYEVLSSTEWNPNTPFSPRAFYDVSDTLALKIKALKAYAGEMRDFPHPRSYDAVEALARVRGSTVGVQAAEAFELIWERT